MNYEVLKSHPTPSAPATLAGDVILADIGEDRLHRYVTGWRAEGDTSWNWGHYFNDLNEATHDYKLRVSRGY